MKNITKLLLAAGFMSLMGAAQAQNGTPPADGQGATTGGRAPRATWAPGYLEPGTPQPPYVSADTPQGTGPHPAIMATEPGAEEFVAYYPADLAALGNKKLPTVMWINGSCTYLGNKFRHFLTEIASHDYFVLAGGPMGKPDDGKSETIGIGSNNPLQNPEAPPAPAAAPAPGRAANKLVTHDQISQGIDWAIAENNRKGSKFYHKLDTKNIAVMGQSCGGGVAASFHTDPRVKTLGLWSGAVNRVEGIEKWGSKPTLMLGGDPKYDVVFYMNMKMHETVRDQPGNKLFYAWRNNMTHLGTYRQTNGGELSPIAVSWLDWQLKGDKAASGMFTGKACGLCTNVHWHVLDRLAK